MNVWVLDFTAEGPEPGDYTGYQTVHATREGALRRLQTWLLGFTPLEVIARADADNGSVTADLESGDGTKISYGIHNMPVEE